MLKKISSIQKNAQLYTRFSTLENPSYFSSVKFKDLMINSYLKESLKCKNLKNLTKIQEKSIPILLQRQNALINAETGSGKTICYLIPILNDILNSQNFSDNKGAIILSPTKELCAQIYSQIKLLDPQNVFRVFRTGAITSINQSSHDNFYDATNQNVLSAINWNNIDVLVSTPIQLNTILEQQDQSFYNQNIKPNQIVIDEMDLLLGDANLAKGTNSIIKKFNNKKVSGQHQKRQFILCGASLCKKIDKIPAIDALNKQFENLQIIQSENFHRISENIEHETVNVDESIKNTSFQEIDVLFKVLEISTSEKIIIFCQKGEDAHQITKQLNERGIKAESYYAGLSIAQRNENLIQFTNSDIRALVCTDLASRGIDFKEVGHIIQFDFALNAVDLIHRFGRTGRIGKQGKVTSFVRERDSLLYNKFIELLGRNEKIDTLFSHKRSLRKKEQKTQSQIAKDEYLE